MERDKYYFRKVPVNQKYEKVYSVQQQMTAVGTAPRASTFVKLHRLGHQSMERSMQRDSLRHGVALFNRAHFFDAHEVLEDVWREAPLHSLSRRHLQGMVQLAVAFHHNSKGNYVGARSVLERALRNLHGADSSFPRLDLDRLRAELEIWRRHLDHSERADDKKNEKKDDKKEEKKFEAPDVRRHDVLNSSAPPLPKIKIKISKISKGR